MSLSSDDTDAMILEYALWNLNGRLRSPQCGVMSYNFRYHNTDSNLMCLAAASRTCA